MSTQLVRRWFACLASGDYAGLMELTHPEARFWDDMKAPLHMLPAVGSLPQVLLEPDAFGEFESLDPGVGAPLLRCKLPGGNVLMLETREDKLSLVWLGKDRMRILGQLPRGSRGLEIGVWTGQMAFQLMKTVQPARLHLVDPWVFRDDGDYKKAAYGKPAGSQAKMDGYHKAVCELFAQEIEQGRVVVERANSQEALAKLAPDSLDWAYVDGDHTYEGCLQDLEQLHSVVQPGGLLCGDDYGVVGWWQDGVTRAVEAFAKRHKKSFELVFADKQTGQFLLRRSA